MRVCTLSLLMSLVLCTSQAVAQESEPRRLAADFTLPTMQGDSLRLSSMRGRVVLLNLWATWCKPCLEEMPDLNALHEKLNPSGFSVVGLAVDGDNKATVDRFVERLKITYPVVYGSVADAQRLSGGHATPILPTTLIIDQEGHVVERIVGTVPVPETTRSLRTLLRP